ncbi:MAG: carboxypeptidase regulatory-like domain-containing protein [Deltaproteobacteria bacterium]|nr:carboxypeptidase regulatory-like domain-containing protein [Deltaproteobacteria bacterium]
MKRIALLFGFAAFAACNCDGKLAAGSPCDDAQQCVDGLVCNPEDGTCAEVDECAADADCGQGGICADGSCEANVAGGPCQADASCISGESCIAGVCTPPGGEGTPCATADDCIGGRVCAPDTDICTADLPCTAPADCGLAAHCDANLCVPGCAGLGCDQVVCQGDATTSLSGVVTIPAGTMPLPGVLVYVPTEALDVIAHGPECYRCDADLSGAPLVRAITNVNGEFTLEDVPVGADIPLVMQVGKWRRQIVVPAVAECIDTPLDAGVTRLPKNRSEGDIPQIALTTGGADSLECLFRKLGLDDSEFTLPDGAGAVNFYTGREGSSRYGDSLNGGVDFPVARDWWNDLANLSAYDLVVHSCEGDQDGGNKSAEARQALQDYAYQGGRIFLSHWHNIWIQGGPADMRSVATWDFRDDPPDPQTGYIDMSFEKGQALADWMMVVGGSTTLGELEVHEPQRTNATVDASRAQRWITIEPDGEELVQYFSFNTPVGAPDDQLCGRVVYSDIHVSSGDAEGEPFPDGCTTTDLSAQEKALVFMMFDLASCLVPEEPTCEPTTCEALGQTCGRFANGCGGTIDCGTCQDQPCDDVCNNDCGTLACLLPPGECGPCDGNEDCCPGLLCLSGECVPIGG